MLLTTKYRNRVTFLLKRQLNKKKSQLLNSVSTRGPRGARRLKNKRFRPFRQWISLRIKRRLRYRVFRNRKLRRFNLKYSQTSRLKFFRRLATARVGKQTVQRLSTRSATLRANNTKFRGVKGHVISALKFGLIRRRFVLEDRVARRRVFSYLRDHNHVGFWGQKGRSTVRKRLKNSRRTVLRWSKNALSSRSMFRFWRADVWQTRRALCYKTIRLRNLAASFTEVLAKQVRGKGLRVKPQPKLRDKTSLLKITKLVPLSSQKQKAWAVVVSNQRKLSFMRSMRPSTRPRTPMALYTKLKTASWLYRRFRKRRGSFTKRFAKWGRYRKPRKNLNRLLLRYSRYERNLGSSKSLEKSKSRRKVRKTLSVKAYGTRLSVLKKLYYHRSANRVAVDLFRQPAQFVRARKVKKPSLFVSRRSRLDLQHYKANFFLFWSPYTPSSSQQIAGLFNIARVLPLGAEYGGFRVYRRVGEDCWGEFLYEYLNRQNTLPLYSTWVYGYNTLSNLRGGSIWQSRPPVQVITLPDFGTRQGYLNSKRLVGQAQTRLTSIGFEAVYKKNLRKVAPIKKKPARRKKTRAQTMGEVIASAHKVAFRKKTTALQKSRSFKSAVKKRRLHRQLKSKRLTYSPKLYLSSTNPTRRLSQYRKRGLRGVRNFNFLYRINRFLIRRYKVKMNYYRISWSDFLENYMIRLTNYHFKHPKTTFMGPQVTHEVVKKSPRLFRFHLHSLVKQRISGIKKVSSKAHLLRSALLKQQIRLAPSMYSVVNFFSTLTSQTLYHGVNLYSRGRRQRLRYRKLLTTYLTQQFNQPYDFLNSAVTSSVTALPRHKALLENLIPAPLRQPTRLLKDLKTLQSADKFPNFLTNYLFFKNTFTHNLAPKPLRVATLVRPLEKDLLSLYLGTTKTAFSFSNISPYLGTKQIISRKLLKLFKFHKFTPNVTMWYSQFLVRFLEDCSGKQVLIKFNPFLENYVNFFDLARCAIWFQRVRGFKRILGPKIFIHESLKIICLAFRYKDPTFLANWMRGMLYRMSFWKYRVLFRYLKFLLRYLIFPYFPQLGFRGFKVRLKGKISVAGNARTRTLRYAIGETSYSKFNHRIVSDYNTINTFTGVLGFRIWFFF